MKKLTFYALILFGLTNCRGEMPPPSNGKSETYYFFFLGGQSNMEGYGFNAELPEAYTEPQENVLIFQSTPKEDETTAEGKGRWSVLSPGHGMGFSSSRKKNELSERFGPEISFGKKMSALMPGKKIALVKYAKGGSSIALDSSPWGTWHPDFRKGNRVNQYDHFLATIENALANQDINGDGVRDEIIPSGIAWMQGEQDAYHSEVAAKNYEANLKMLMDLMRAALRQDDLPVAIGQIWDSGKDEDGKLMDWCETVQRAQAGFVQKDGHAALVTTTSQCEFLEDGWHYTSPCYLKLGEEMAEAIFNINQKIKSK